jgi:uncharacterized protein (TIGR02266 family)
MSSPPTPVEQLEADVTQEEASVQAELEKALGQWREVAERLKALRAQVAQAKGLGLDVLELHTRVEALKLPTLEPGTSMLRAEAVRREAVAARRAGLLELKSRIPPFSSDVSRLQLRVSAEEGSVTKEIAKAKAVAQQVAEAAKKLEAPESAPQPAPTPIGRLRPAAAMREQPRVRMQVKIDFGSDNNFYSGFSTNISDGGVFIATVKLVRIGTPIDLFFRLPTGEGIECHGVVRWVREVDDRMPEMMPGLGVQFVKLSPEAQKAVQDFVRDREPMFYPD